MYACIARVDYLRKRIPSNSFDFESKMSRSTRPPGRGGDRLVRFTKAEKKKEVRSSLIASALLRKTDTLDPQEAALGTNLEGEGIPAGGDPVGGHTEDSLDAGLP